MPQVSDGGWCECGLAANDPNHEAWCRLWWWNREVFAVARAKREREFDAEVEGHQKRVGRVPVDPQARLDVTHTVGGKTYSR